MLITHKMHPETPYINAQGLFVCIILSMLASSYACLEYIRIKSNNQKKEVLESKQEDTTPLMEI